MRKDYFYKYFIGIFIVTICFKSCNYWCNQTYIYKSLFWLLFLI